MKYVHKQIIVENEKIVRNLSNVTKKHSQLQKNYKKIENKKEVLEILYNESAANNTMNKFYQDIHNMKTRHSSQPRKNTASELQISKLKSIRKQKFDFLNEPYQEEMVKKLSLI